MLSSNGVAQLHEYRVQTLLTGKTEDPLNFKVQKGILGKAYYDLVQIKLKRHRTQITIAKTQNLLLHAALETLREKDKIARKNAGDLEALRKTAVHLRVTYDHQRQLVFKTQGKLEWQITTTHSAENQCAAVLDPNTPLDVRIRNLEHKVTWNRLKMKDVQILVKHYETVVQSLKDEWVTYESKLAALQGHVNVKNHEYEQLINTYHDAVRARDAAKVELEELLASLFGYGKKKRASIVDKYAVAGMVEGARLMARRQSSLKGSSPLLQILDGTQRLVDRLTEGNLTLMVPDTTQKKVMEDCKERLIQLLQALHRKLRHVNKANAKTAEFEAKEKAHWEREDAEVARKKKAAEEARRKYEERVAAKEAQRETAEKEMKHKLQMMAPVEFLTPEVTAGDPPDTPVGSGDQELVQHTTSGSGFKQHSKNQMDMDAEAKLPGGQLKSTVAEMPTMIFLPSIQQQVIPDVRGGKKVETEPDRQREDTASQTSGSLLGVASNIATQPNIKTQSITVSSKNAHEAKLAKAGLPISTTLTSRALTQPAEVAPSAAEGIPIPTSPAPDLEGIPHISSTLSTDTSTASRQVETRQPVTVETSSDGRAVQRMVETRQVTTVTSCESIRPADASNLTDMSVQEKAVESHTLVPGAIVSAESSVAGTIVPIETLSIAEGAEGTIVHTIGALSSIESSAVSSSESTAASTIDQTSGSLSIAESTTAQLATPSSYRGAILSKERAVGSPGSSSMDEVHAEEEGLAGQVALLSLPQMPEGADGRPPTSADIGSPGLVPSSNDETSVTKLAQTISSERAPGKEVAVIHLPKDGSFKAKLVSGTSEESTLLGLVEEKTPPGDKTFAGKSTEENKATDVLSESQGAFETQPKQLEEASLESASTHPDEGLTPEIALSTDENLTAKLAGGSKAEDVPVRLIAGASATLAKGETPSERIEVTECVTLLSKHIEEPDSAQLGGGSPDAFPTDDSIAVKPAVGTRAEGIPVRQAEGQFPTVEAAGCDESSVVKTSLQDTAELPTDKSALIHVVEAGPLTAVALSSDLTGAGREEGTRLPTIVISSDGRVSASSASTLATTQDEKVSYRLTDDLGLAAGLSQETGAPTTEPVEVAHAPRTVPVEGHDPTSKPVEQLHTPTSAPVSNYGQPPQMSAEIVTVPLVLPRSPSGAPIVTAVWSPKVDIVTSDDTGTPRFTSGALTAGSVSPILPRSPSGAPISTAVRFPLELPSNDGSGLRQRGTRQSLSRPLSQTSVPTEGLTESEMPEEGQIEAAGPPA